MITKDCIETAYCFFHQKWRVYQYSKDQHQRDEIECAIASYAETMNEDLYNRLSTGVPDFLYSHSHFESDIQAAVGRLELLL